MTGRVFEIREFTLHDGPGVRTTVFLKGCPLRCAWCHNPEGQSPDVETMRHKDGSATVCGDDWTPEALAEELLKNADILSQSGGGVTFSGGEPLAQPDFVLAVVRLIRSRNRTIKRSSSQNAEQSGNFSLAIETSGCTDPRTYQRVVSQMDFVYQDLKHHDQEAFRRWCGGALDDVLQNVAWLKTSGVRHVFRVPCIPGVNDSPADREAFRRIAGTSPIEFLPYNPAAGAKYPMLGRDYPLTTVRQPRS